MKNGFLLVNASLASDDSLSLNSDIVEIFEKVKLIQQRYPLVQVLGFVSGNSVCSSTNQNRIVQLILNEYITFPILLSNQIFSEVTDGVCFIVFKEFGSPQHCYESSIDLAILHNAIEELSVQKHVDSRLTYKFEGTGSKLNEVFKEPLICSSLRNLLIYFPGCISVDEMGSRLFLSDSNHHRIIVIDGNGKILDCIGSSPGFEDGDFESAKLMRPAASFYHAAQDCLYFVDSENHAVRRADLERRVLETLYPMPNSNEKHNSLWSWLMSKFGVGRSADLKCADVSSEPLRFPWHLINPDDGTLLVVNRSFEYLWVLDIASTEIKEIIAGYPKVLEICGPMIMEKLNILKQVLFDQKHEQDDFNSLKGIPFAGLISSFEIFNNHLIICDPVTQRVIKYCRESGAFSNFEFSNFGILGLPYWVSFPLEKVYNDSNILFGAGADHLQSFSLLPGKVDIKLLVTLPKDTELVEPLQDGCIWRQARGCATEISCAENLVASKEKVTAAQQWYDDLDNLVFEPLESQMTEAVNTSLVRSSQADGLCISCAARTSPGTSEVIIHAAIYLRLLRSPKDNGSQERNASRIVDILNPNHNIETVERDACIGFLSRSKRDLASLVFLKPLRVRVKLDCADHPKGDNLRSVILTDSSIEVDVSLDS